MFRGPVLLLALVLSTPALWRCLVDHETDLASALLRLIIAIPVAWLMLLVLRYVTNSYREAAQAKLEAEESAARIAAMESLRAQSQAARSMD
jgi:hypothetical protein